MASTSDALNAAAHFWTICIASSSGPASAGDVIATSSNNPHNHARTRASSTCAVSGARPLYAAPFTDVAVSGRPLWMIERVKAGGWTQERALVEANALRPGRSSAPVRPRLPEEESDVRDG